MISFPKSGRTWLRVMLDDLGVEAVYTHSGAGHSKSRPISEVTTEREAEFERILFLHRDPRDTVVSGYHQKSARKGGYDGTISDFIRDPCHGIEKIIEYNRMWFDLARQRGRMKIVSYEALRANAVEELAGILEFFGHTPDRARIAEVVEANTFSKMRQREAAGAFIEKYGLSLAPADPNDPNSYKVRRGKIGGYRDELSEEDVAFCDAAVAAAAQDPANSPPAL